MDTNICNVGYCVLTEQLTPGHTVVQSGGTGRNGKGEWCRARGRRICKGASTRGARAGATTAGDTTDGECFLLDGFWRMTKCARRGWTFQTRCSQGRIARKIDRRGCPRVDTGTGCFFFRRTTVVAAVSRGYAQEVGNEAER